MNSEESSDRLKDPKIAALMASVAGPESHQEDQMKDKEKVLHPPTTFEEFLQIENIDDWPLKLPSEGILLPEDSLFVIPTFDDLKDELAESAPFGFETYDNLEAEMEAFNDRLTYFSSFLTSSESLPSRIPDGLFHAPRQEFLDKAATSDAVVLHHGRGGKMKDVKQTLQEEAQEMRTRNIEYISFGGFRSSELSELPSQLEAPQLLNKVMEAQPFNKGIHQLWKKLFLSPASVAILQDTFWWFFLENFQHNPVAQDRLYTRIADSYVALFFSVHPDMRDKFFKDYPRCLAQSVYLTFVEAFPESRDRFNEEFVSELSNMTSEWITGVKPSTGDWKKWPWEKLCPRPGGVATMPETEHERASKMRRPTGIPINMTFDIDDYLERSSATPSDGKQFIPSIIVSKPEETSASKLARADAQGSSQTEKSKVQQQPRLHPVVDSAQSGPGPDLERVLFNTSGRSPLVAHHLYMKNLRCKEDFGKTMKRTEILQEPPPSMTFKEIIDQSKKNVKKLHEQWLRSELETHEHIQKLHRQHKLALMKMNPIEHTKMDPMELKIISEKLIDEAKEKGPVYRFERDNDPNIAMASVSQDDEHKEN